MKSFQTVFYYILFALIFLLQVHNAIYYPETRGFDSRAHIEYINFIRDTRRLPLPDQGWEMFQAPLYYFLCSFFYDNKSAQFLGLFIWILLFLSISKLIDKSVANINKNDTLLIKIFLVTIPIIVYITPAIGNEFISTVAISIFLVKYKLTSKIQNRSYIENLYLGILLGLALLCKATSIITMMAFILSEFLNGKSPKLVIKNLWVSLLIACSIGGWFYFRSYLLYKNIIYQPADYIPLSSYAQPIVNRDLNFFFSVKSLISFDIMKAHYYSFLGGTFFSWYYDGHTVLLPVQEFSKSGVTLVILSLPFFLLTVLGYLLELRTKSPQYLYIIYPVLLMFFYVMYNFKLPFYSTVKSVFISSLFIPYSYFYVKGYRKLGSSARFFIKILMVLYILLVFKIFWVQPSWYLI